MSADLRIEQVCPHEVSDEALFLADDRRTVRPLRPIASSGSVRVFLNHAQLVPSYGVFLPAHVQGSRRGPFDIKRDTSPLRKDGNDTIELRVNAGPVQTVVLPAANRMAPHQVAAYLNRRLDGVTFSVVNSALAMTSRESGPGVSIFLTANSTASSLLGLASPREYRGRQNVPGWTLVSDPNTLADRPTRLIVFDEPLRSGSDFVEVSYGTVREECRRCGGIGREHDWRYAKNGDLLLVRDEDLLLQELQKMFFTLIGSNPFNRWYGTGIMDVIGRKLTPNGVTQTMIVSGINEAFKQWQGIKRQQEEVVYVSDREFPFRLVSVSLQKSSQDPTVIFVDVTVQNRSNETISLSRGFRSPQALDGGSGRQSLSNYTLVG